MSGKLSTKKHLKLQESTFPDDEVFRPIHYLGSKLRILDFIEKNIDKIDPNKGRVCDLFSGSGSVSFKLSKSRPVTSVDIQEYSRIICSALLTPVDISNNFIDEFINKCVNSKHNLNLNWAVQDIINHEKKCIKMALIGQNLEQLCDILEKGSIISYELRKNKSSVSNLISTTISNLSSKDISKQQSLTIRYFGGVYFSYYQALQIDVILEQIDHTPIEFKNQLKAALLSTVSECVNTVGKQFAQPIRPRKSNGEIKKTLGKMVSKDRALDVYEIFRKWINRYKDISTASTENKVLKMDFEQALDMLPKDTSVVYADPPYTRDHYSRFYHVLETISLRDTPEISTMKSKGEILLSRGLYRENRHQSPFCIRSKAPSAFETMFSKTSSLGAALVLSYSPYDETQNTHPRVVTMKQLIDLANKYFSSVEILSPGTFIHSKLNHSSRHLEASSAAEVLIVCR